jgi:spore coat protein U-like protein
MTRHAASVLAAAVLCVVLGSAPVEAACTLSATPMAFGAYNVFQAGPDDSTGSITYRCSIGDRNIRISISAGASGTFADRTLKDGTETLQYNLFYGGFTQVWGDGSGGTTAYFENNPPNNKDVVLTVYGRITAGQDVAIGNYTDTVVVTLNY